MEGEQGFDHYRAESMPSTSDTFKTRFVVVAVFLKKSPNQYYKTIRD